MARGGNTRNANSANRGSKNKHRGKHGGGGNRHGAKGRQGAGRAGRHFAKSSSSGRSGSRSGRSASAGRAGGSAGGSGGSESGDTSGGGDGVGGYGDGELATTSGDIATTDLSKVNLYKFIRRKQGVDMEQVRQFVSKLQHKFQTFYNATQPTIPSDVIDAIQNPIQKYFTFPIRHDICIDHFANLKQCLMIHDQHAVHCDSYLDILATCQKHRGDPSL